RFRQEGEIQGVEDELKYGFHSGIIHHNYGDKAQLPGVREELFLSGYTIKDHTVTYAPVDYFRRTRVLLVNCRISEETSLREPITGVVRFANHNMTECWIYPNSINGATLEWENPLEVKEGEIVSVFKKKGKNAKVFLTGEIRFLDEQRGPQN